MWALYTYFQFSVFKKPLECSERKINHLKYTETCIWGGPFFPFASGFNLAGHGFAGACFNDNFDIFVHHELFTLILIVKIFLICIAEFVASPF